MNTHDSPAGHWRPPPPFVKLICMGRAFMISGLVGSNVEGVLKGEDRELIVDAQLVRSP